MSVRKISENRTNMNIFKRAITRRKGRKLKRNFNRKFERDKIRK